VQVSLRYQVIVRLHHHMREHIGLPLRKTSRRRVRIRGLVAIEQLELALSEHLTRDIECRDCPHFKYAMAGGNAVAAWVARVDRAAVRNTQDVDLLVRRKDQIHLLDMLSLGLIDASWLPRLVPKHAARLQQLIDDPDG
jgi:hypothetical protein